MIPSAKRLFDLLASASGLVFLAPLFVSISLLIRKDGGPAFFRQERVGQGGKIFKIYKFRTMCVDADKMGALVTQTNDPRITKIGQLLRRTKLDELPQLINVFLGDMSIVGPRPEVPYYVRFWGEADKEKILSVKPGITDHASLLFSDEQGVLAAAEDPEKAYIEEILPKKVELYKRYVEDQSLAGDLKLILSTLFKVSTQKAKKR